MVVELNLLSWICSRWLIKMFAGPKIADESCKCKYWPCLKSWDWLTLPRQSILLTGQNQKTSLSATTSTATWSAGRTQGGPRVSGGWFSLSLHTGAIGPLLSSLTCTQLEMRMKQLDQAATGCCSWFVTLAEWGSTAEVILTHGSLSSVRYQARLEWGGWQGC